MFLTEKPKFHQRDVKRSDLKAILDIENRSFPHPWPEEEFVGAIRMRNGFGRVVTADDIVVGYMIYVIFKNRIELWNFAVHPEWRLCGIGRMMHESLRFKLNGANRNRLELMVSERNLDACLFFRKMGYKALEVVHGVFEPWSNEDAYFMRYKLTERSEVY